jgi:hypothetical protein
VARLSIVKRIPIGVLLVRATTAALFTCAVSAALFTCATSAQLPRVGDINFYGLRKLTPNEILAAAHLGPGDTVPASRVQLEDRIIELPDVMDAHVQSLCCEGDRTTLFIGVRERGEPGIEFHERPSGKATLPEDLMTRYRKYEGALLRAEMNGNAGASDPAMRRDQEYFRTFAASHIAPLRAELHTGSDAEQRAAAATVFGYSPDKKGAVDDLTFALRDPDEDVRAHALRSLAAIAAQHASGILIQAAVLVDLLNSVVLSDRMESTKALLVLTERPNAVALDLIRAHALLSLAEMARWQTRTYAQPPFRLLGRVAGLKDSEVNESWEKDDREPVIQKATDSAPKKPGLQPGGLQ